MNSELFLADDKITADKKQMFSVPKELKIGHLTDIHLKLDYFKWGPGLDGFCNSKG
jgi:hypothetical protein